MSIFDKFFSIRNRSNNNDTAFKPETEGLRSSHLSISKDQIRFVLFRECDKRGRKLLFDSSSVEKVSLLSNENMCNIQCQNPSEKSTDFIETTKTHGYKYKKPPSDVSSLGEMVFGSVAVVYKAENSCKIHSIPSPKRLMFTTIIHAPFHRSPGSTASDHSSGNSLASLTNILSQQLMSSSDSKLYKRDGIAQNYSSTYPWIKLRFSSAEVKYSCDNNDVDYNLSSKSFLSSSSESKCSESIYLNKNTGGSEKFCTKRNFSVLSGNNLCQCHTNSDCENFCLCYCGSSGVTSSASGNISSVSGSLSSLRRRWFHSYSTSLDSTSYEDTGSSPSKKRTKLGMALIVDLSNTLEDEIEKLLFNHTIIIDSIMCKLQDSVELAYVQNENFVDLIYSAVLESQQSIYELVTSGKYETPIWCTVLGDFDDGLESQLARMNFYKKNMETNTKQDLINNVQFKFLNDFCNVLVKFDTKDTNFFFSTLLTAVLTYHLSWVPTITETDFKSPNEELSVINGIRPYNPVWAQINDLCGLLGYPLKSAKTVVTGPLSKKNLLGTMIEVLNYFIRCNNVMENIYEVDVKDIIGDADSKCSGSDFDSVIESDIYSSSAAVNLEKQCFNSTLDGKPCDKEQRSVQKPKTEVMLSKQNDFKNTERETGLKRSKSYLTMEDAIKPELYPDITDLAKSENINIADLDYIENERTIFVESFLSGDKLREKIQKMIRVPNVCSKPRGEEYLSPDEGYDTIDSIKTDNYKENKVQMERQGSALDRKENIVFLLGENEELVNLTRKVVVNKSDFVDIEKEERRDCLSDQCANPHSEENNAGNREGNSKVLENSSGNVDRTYWVQHSTNKNDILRNYSAKKNWIVQEIKMPRTVKPCRTRRLEVSSVLGDVNQHYNSHQVIQGVLEPKSAFEKQLQKDLFLCAHNPILDKNVSESLCIVGDMDSCEVTVFSSNRSSLDSNKQAGVRVGMSQLVADMLESLLYLHTSNLSPTFLQRQENVDCNLKTLKLQLHLRCLTKCLFHIEKKLHEIYLKSKMVVELLNSTELCSMDHLTTSLNIGISDVPLLLSVATTHSPHIAEKYALSYS